MRPIHLTDLDATVRALLAHPEDDWFQEAQDIVKRARYGDSYRKRFRKALAGCGTGTLSSAVSGKQAVKTEHCDHRYRRCLATLLRVLG